MDNALLSFFRQDKDLVTDNRPLRLRLAHATQMLEDVLLPQRVHGSESICGGIEYRILCVSLDAFIPLKEMIALPAAVDIVTDVAICAASAVSSQKLMPVIALAAWPATS